ncbi:ABC transporter permease subunit [Corynebacterium freiburgense]|uniref:ABC transporter permease subunit n=1 Tax=Corynebacterium freiburgense TaxID=556548 RepID=UPI00041A3F0E|nr:ABC transporter permease subunit [Corynebacterium freiburgense]WJZ02876.1 putative D,D-dipeptide transport system permease protein DdpC [Corynebacterium freiburgense]
MPQRNHRILQTTCTSLALFLSAAAITAILPFLGNRDLAMAVFRAREAERTPDPEILEAIRKELQLPATPFEGFTSWLAGALRGDFGVSWVDPSRSAIDVALSGFGVSATLAGLSTSLAVVLAWLLAWPRFRAVVHGKPSRTGDIVGMAILGSIPEFVLAVVLLVLFALKFQWFPVSGFSSIHHMVLPTLAIALPSAGLLGRVLLITIDAVAKEEWVRAWRLNNVRSQVIFRAISKRALAVLTPQIVLFFAGSLASTALIETTFNIAGMGRTAVAAAISRDIPVLQVIVLTVVILGIVCGILAQWARWLLLRPLLGSDAAYAPSATARNSRPRGTIAFALVTLPFLALFLVLLLTDAPPLDITQRLVPPSAPHILGTDQLGRDLLLRLAHGATLTIGLAVLVTAICALIGLVLGLMGSWASRIGDALNALPAILIGVILAGVFGGSQTTAAIAVMLVGWIPLASHTAVVAAEARTTGYYLWAQLQGASMFRLIWWHVLPTVIPAVIRHAASRVAHNALALAGLGFLGLGAPHDSPDWGVILSESIRYAERAPWMMLAPTLLLMALGVAAALATDTRITLRSKS